MKPANVVNGVLVLAVVVSAAFVVVVKQQSRELFFESQELVQAKDALDVEWGRLQLEQGAWGTHGRVERVARDELKMVKPESRHLLVIKPRG